MTVRIGKMAFSDWASLPFPGGWSDTFVFRIDALACIPPFAYAPLLKRLVTHTKKLRSSASIWVQVDAPGAWYIAEVKRSLRGLSLPYAVTHAHQELDYLDFSFRPALLHAPSPAPPQFIEPPPTISLGALRCLQALGRMKKGNEHELASMANLSLDVTQTQLQILAQKKLVVLKISPKIRRGRIDSPLDGFPLWHLTPEGLSIALRSWGVPKGVEFTARWEEHLQQIGSEHRHISRIWLSWLKTAWPHAEIWTAWSEVRMPGLSVIPDGLAWGKIQGYESLLWLEVGDEHKSRNTISKITATRMDQASDLCERSGVRLVYVQLSSAWVHEAAQWASVNSSKEVAVVMGNRRQFGKLPMLEWENSVEK